MTPLRPLAAASDFYYVAMDFGGHGLSSHYSPGLPYYYQNFVGEIRRVSAGKRQCVGSGAPPHCGGVVVRKQGWPGGALRQASALGDREAGGGRQEGPLPPAGAPQVLGQRWGRLAPQTWLCAFSLEVGSLLHHGPQFW